MGRQAELAPKMTERENEQSVSAPERKTKKEIITWSYLSPLN